MTLRSYCYAVTVGGYIYIFGARTLRSDGKADRSTFRYDPHRDVYKRMADMPEGARFIVHGSYHGCIYAVHGETDFEMLARRGEPIRDENDNPAVLGVALSRRKPRPRPGMPAPPESKMPDTRIVAIGDSSLATEAILRAHSPNGDLLLNAVRWLAAKERHLGIAKRTRRRPRIEGMSNQEVRALRFLVVGGLPLLAALLGALIWWVRRR